MECLHRTKEVRRVQPSLSGALADHILPSHPSTILHILNQTASLPTMLHTSHLSRIVHITQPSTSPQIHNSATQIARAKEIKTHFLQKQAHENKDARKAAERGATGAIVSLGLVEEEGSGGGK
jgi:hypothetical protein